jgi:hypothetical protein
MFIRCPSCGLQHRARDDMRCPRCKSSVEGGEVVAQAPSPVGTPMSPPPPAPAALPRSPTRSGPGVSTPAPLPGSPTRAGPAAGRAALPRSPTGGGAGLGQAAPLPRTPTGSGPGAATAATLPRSPTGSGPGAATAATLPRAPTGSGPGAATAASLPRTQTRSGSGAPPPAVPAPAALTPGIAIAAGAGTRRSRLRLGAGAAGVVIVLAAFVKMSGRDDHIPPARAALDPRVCTERAIVDIDRTCISNCEVTCTVVDTSRQKARPGARDVMCRPPGLWFSDKPKAEGEPDDPFYYAPHEKLVDEASKKLPAAMQEQLAALGACLDRCYDAGIASCEAAIKKDAGAKAGGAPLTPMAGAEEVQAGRTSLKTRAASGATEVVSMATVRFRVQASVSEVMEHYAAEMKKKELPVYRCSAMPQQCSAGEGADFIEARDAGDGFKDHPSRISIRAHELENPGREKGKEKGPAKSRGRAQEKKEKPTTAVVISWAE